MTSIRQMYEKVKNGRMMSICHPNYVEYLLIVFDWVCDGCFSALNPSIIWQTLEYILDSYWRALLFLQKEAE